MIGKVVHQLRNGWHFLHKIFIVYNSASKTSKKDRQQPIRKTHVLHGGSTRKCARTMKNSLNLPDQFSMWYRLEGKAFLYISLKAVTVAFQNTEYFYFLLFTGTHLELDYFSAIAWKTSFRRSWNTSHIIDFIIT